jgi:hypothetical protein
MSFRNFSITTVLCLFVIGIPQLALALPKQGTGQCRCTCVAPSGILGGQIWSDNVVNANGFFCGAFAGKTCNVGNPNTGGVATGEINGCEVALASRRSVIIFNPITGGKLVPSKHRSVAAQKSTRMFARSW